MLGSADVDDEQVEIGEHDADTDDRQHLLGFYRGLAGLRRGRRRGGGIGQWSNQAAGGAAIGRFKPPHFDTEHELFYFLHDDDSVGSGGCACR